MEFDRLPFVSHGGGIHPRNFWAPRPTGDYSFDCSLGAEYAIAALPLMGLGGVAGLLPAIVTNMVHHGDLAKDSGVIVGMMTVFERELVRRVRA
jgi:hypothetical protein